jgi:hypothetical protein
MFIVHASKKSRLKPRRGGMGLPVAVDAAPTGLGRIVRRHGTINMSPRWGLAPASECADRPKESAQATAARPRRGRHHLKLSGPIRGRRLLPAAAGELFVRRP